MPFFITKCDFCNYRTDIKCNLIRHQHTKHKDEILEKQQLLENVQNVIPNIQNVIPNIQNVIPKIQNDIPNTEMSKIKEADDTYPSEIYQQ